MEVVYYRDRNLIVYQIQTNQNKSRRIQLPLCGPAEGHTPFWQKKDKIIRRTVTEIICAKHNLSRDSVDVTIKSRPIQQ